MKEREVKNNFKKLLLLKTKIFRELVFGIDGSFFCVFKFLFNKLLKAKLIIDIATSSGSQVKHVIPLASA